MRHFYVQAGQLFLVGQFVLSVSAFFQSYCQAPLPSPDSYKPIEGYELALVQIVGRHGDRSPCNVLPHDDTMWHCDSLRLIGPGDSLGYRIRQHHEDDRRIWQGSCHAGQLSPKGWRQLQSLGQAVSQVYAAHGLLSRLPCPEELFVRATHKARSQQSAMAFIDGVLNKNEGSCREDLQGNTDSSCGTKATLPTAQWADIHVAPEERESMLANGAACPQLQAMDRGLFDSPAWVEYLQTAQPILDQLHAVLGTKGVPGWQKMVNFFFDNIAARLCNNKPLPCSKGDPQVCVDMRLAEEVFRLALWEFRQKYIVDHGVPRLRLTIGPLLTTVLSAMQSALTDTHTGPRLHFYSGHDDTLTPLLGALNITITSWPSYGSALAIELWRPVSGEGAVVRVLYNWQPTQTFAQCEGTQCAWDTFKGMVGEYVPANWVVECNQPLPASGP